MRCFFGVCIHPCRSTFREIGVATENNPSKYEFGRGKNKIKKIQPKDRQIPSYREMVNPEEGQGGRGQQVLDLRN
jgi:hypothetical protein